VFVAPLGAPLGWGAPHLGSGCRNPSRPPRLPLGPSYGARFQAGSKVIRCHKVLGGTTKGEVEGQSGARLDGCSPGEHPPCRRNPHPRQRGVPILGRNAIGLIFSSCLQRLEKYFPCWHRNEEIKSVWLGFFFFPLKSTVQGLKL